MKAQKNNNTTKRVPAPSLSASSEKKLSREEIEQKKLERQNRYFAECKPLHLFYYILFGAAALVLLLFFAQFVYVDNTSYGREVSVTGWNFVFALLSGGFESASFGDIAVPFYMYAQVYTVIASVIDLLVLVFILLTFVLLAVILHKKKYVLSYFVALLTVLTALCMIAEYVVCLMMNGSDVLPVYCSGNPECSIGSDAIYPLIFALVMAGLAIYISVRHARAEQLLHGKRRP